MGKINLIIFLLFLVKGFTQENGLELLEQGINRFKSVQKPFIDSCDHLYTHEVITSRIFKDVDTIYLYDEYDTSSATLIETFESKAKEVIKIDQEWLDSTNVYLYSISENPSPEIKGLNCGIVFRAKGFKEFSYCLYSNSKRISEALYFSRGLFGKTELERLFLQNNDLIKVFDKRYISRTYKLKSLNNSEVNLEFIHRKSIFSKPILFIDGTTQTVEIKVNRFGKIKYYTVRDKNRDYSKAEMSELTKHLPPENLRYLW